GGAVGAVQLDGVHRGPQRRVLPVAVLLVAQRLVLQHGAPVGAELEGAAVGARLGGGGGGGLWPRLPRGGRAAVAGPPHPVAARRPCRCRGPRPPSRRSTGALAASARGPAARARRWRSWTPPPTRRARGSPRSRPPRWRSRARPARGRARPPRPRPGDSAGAWRQAPRRDTSTRSRGR